MSRADRLRVVQRGGDQVVEVDRLDVERLAHMGAAVAQDLHHLGLVLHGIEMRLHRLRLSRHFAQRERGRKNLDEDDDFHLGLLALLHYARCRWLPTPSVRCRSRKAEAWGESNRPIEPLLQR